MSAFAVAFGVKRISLFAAIAKRSSAQPNAPYCFLLSFGARAADVRFASSVCLNWARQTGLSFSMFLIMQAAIRGKLGMSLPQNLNASCVQAHCCSGVPSA